MYEAQEWEDRGLSDALWISGCGINLEIHSKLSQIGISDGSRGVSWAYLKSGGSGVLIDE